VDPTENTVPLTWVARGHVFHCSGTVRLAPERVATPLPAALLLLRDVTAVPETCLPSRCLATAVSAGFTIPALNRHDTIFTATTDVNTNVGIHTFSTYIYTQTLHIHGPTYTHMHVRTGIAVSV
jgi:hypothetical protein